MSRRAALLLLPALALAACADRACGGRGGLPPGGMPIVKRGDGRADYIAHYDENRQIRLIEVDEDHDSWVDRFEYYDAAGILEKVGRCRKQKGRVDEWTYRAPDGRPSRIEYDDDGDGKPERAEVMKEGALVRIEMDTDRDGRPDRWQDWDHGRIVSEEIDTNGDGKPDRRLVFGPKARLLRVERVQK